MPARRAAGRPTPVLGHLQRLAELLLGKQFMRLDLLEGACAGDRDAQRGGADRAGEVGGGDPVVGPEHPVRLCAVAGSTGFAARAGPAVRIVNAPFSDERYGIGIRKGDLADCEAVNKAVSEMYLDGTAAALLHKWFGKTTLQPATTCPSSRGCG